MARGDECLTNGCTRISQVRGLCKGCYEKFRRAHNGYLSSEHGSIRDISEIDAAYMAGMIDADGMITVSARHTRKDRTVARPLPLVMVTSSDMVLIDWFKEKIGAGTSYRAKTKPHRKDQDKDNWNPVHRYQITGLKAISLIEVILPYLIIKRDRANIVKMVPMRGKDFAQGATPDQIALSERIVEQVRTMNKRGREKHCLFRPLPLEVFGEH